jgi:hypothetical protein
VGNCQILWMAVFQAAGFSRFTPSMKTSPRMTSGSRLEPFKARHPFEADPINLETIVRHADRLPLPFALP